MAGELRPPPARGASSRSSAPPLSDGASTPRCNAGLTRADETDSPAHYPSGSANATRRASGPAPVAIRMNCRPARER